MLTLVLRSAAVNGILTGSTPAAPGATPVAPRTFAYGICILAIAALVRMALLVRLAAFHSVIPLLRAIILVLLTLVLLAAFVSHAAMGDGQPLPIATAERPAPGGVPR
jgi:hypothetical protein